MIDFFAIMPIERTISSLPISFAGVGLREKIFQIMLHGLCGVPEAVAVLIGSMSFLVMLALLRAGRDRLFLLQTERPGRAREAERDAQGSGDAGA